MKGRRFIPVWAIMFVSISGEYQSGMHDVILNFLVFQIKINKVVHSNLSWRCRSMYITVPGLSHLSRSLIHLCIAFCLN